MLRLRKAGRSSQRVSVKLCAFSSSFSASRHYCSASRTRFSHTCPSFYRSQSSLFASSFLSSSRCFSSSASGPLAVYRDLVARGKLIDDAGQAKVAQLLQDLYDKILSGGSSSRVSVKQSEPEQEPASSWLGGWFSQKSKPAPAPEKTVQVGIPGLYLYGGVGTGKTMLVDMFLDCLPPSVKKKRTHFHAFMLDVHARIFKMSKQDQYKGDPLPEVARQIARDASVLAFDEFQVNDVADAVIMKRLFSELFAQGCVVIATSNRAPADLYLNGINRHLFLPFIDLLNKSTTVHKMTANAATASPSSPSPRSSSPSSSSPRTPSVSTPTPSPSQSPSPLFTPASDGTTDYRRVKGTEKLVEWAYITPITPENERKLDLVYDYLLAGKPLASLPPLSSSSSTFSSAPPTPIISPTTTSSSGLPRARPPPVPLREFEEEWELKVVTGRGMNVRGNRERGVARFSFQALCGHDLGAADYISIASAVHTVVITHVPVLRTDHAHCHRFITLIDVLYEAHTRVVFLAAAIPDSLFDYSGSVVMPSKPRGVEYAAASQIDRNAPGNSLQPLSVHESAFGVGRLRSRLIEMQAESYWKKSGKME